MTVQAQILELIKNLQQKFKMAVILITHDLGVIAETCDRVAVMYCGEIVESAPVKALFERPRHPYTKGLLESVLALNAEDKKKGPTPHHRRHGPSPLRPPRRLFLPRPLPMGLGAVPRPFSWAET